MNTTRTATHAGQTFTVIGKATKFVSFYSTTEAPEKFLLVEHRSENAARKGSWQSAEMRARWVYRGYTAV